MRSRVTPAGQARGSRRHASCSRWLEEWHERKQITGDASLATGPAFPGDAKRSAAGVLDAQFLGVARQSPPRG